MVSRAGLEPVEAIDNTQVTEFIKGTKGQKGQISSKCHHSVTTELKRRNVCSACFALNLFIAA